MNAKHQISEYLLQQNVQNHLKGVETSKLSQYNTSFIKQNIGESNVRYLLFIWSKLILPYLLKKCKSIHFWLAQQQLSTLNHSDWTASSWEGAKQITDDICKVVIYINQQWPPRHKRILTLQELHYSHSQQIKGQSKNNILEYQIIHDLNLIFKVTALKYNSKNVPPQVMVPKSFAVKSLLTLRHSKHNNNFYIASNILRFTITSLKQLMFTWLSINF